MISVVRGEWLEVMEGIDREKWSVEGRERWVWLRVVKVKRGRKERGL